MPSPPKFHPHRSVLFVTFSVEQGLLLLANPLCRAIVESCLARAQALHPVKVCHFLVSSTHIHLIIVVDNPADVPGFMNRFKTESAHMLNRVLGRKKRTVWCEGYDSPVVLSRERAMLAIAYLYANPAKDNLIESIDNYPGLSSWSMFRQGRFTKIWKRICRPAFRVLPADAHNLRGYEKEATRVLRESRTSHSFTISPNAWLEAFGIIDQQEQLRINERLVDHIRLLEKRASEKRAIAGRRIIGRERLIARPMDRYYEPNREGKRMLCLADRREIRIPFINFLKELVREARRIYQKWFLGDYREPYPLGLYPPSMPKLAEPIWQFR